MSKDRCDNPSCGICYHGNDFRAWRWSPEPVLFGFFDAKRSMARWHITEADLLEATAWTGP